MITIGTNHFVSGAAAREYYWDYGYDRADLAVEEKIISGEICIGPPPAKKGYEILLTDGGKRYMYRERPGHPNW